MLTPSASAIVRRTCIRTYPGRAEQVSAVRADLHALLADCPHVDDIVLCASELAANAAIHSNSADPGGTVAVHAEIRDGDYVRIEVRDNGGPWIHPTADDDRRHGLDIVRNLASQWGITGTDAGRAVWAQLDWPVA